MVKTWLKKKINYISTFGANVSTFIKATASLGQACVMSPPIGRAAEVCFENLFFFVSQAFCL